MLIPKRLSVGKTERYTVGVSQWLDGETLQSATVTSDEKVTIGSSDIQDSIIGFFATGVSTGDCTIKLEFSTATRSDCYTITIIVNKC